MSEVSPAEDRAGRIAGAPALNSALREAPEAIAAASAVGKLRSVVTAMRAERRFEDEAAHFAGWLARHAPR